MRLNVYVQIMIRPTLGFKLNKKILRGQARVQLLQDIAMVSVLQPLRLSLALSSLHPPHMHMHVLAPRSLHPPPVHILFMFVVLLLFGHLILCKGQKIMQNLNKPYLIFFFFFVN